MELILLGIALSAALWAAALWSLQRATETAVAAAPPGWRVRFAASYDEALSFRVRDAFISTRTLLAASFWLAAFVILDLFDVLLVVQLGMAVAYAAWMTAHDRKQRRERVATLVAEGLESLPASRRLGWWYDGSVLATWVGFFGATCFLARLAVDLFGR